MTTLAAFKAEPLRDIEVRGGFLKLTRGSETGAPIGCVWVQAAQIQTVERETWAQAFTRLHMRGDLTVRVMETPEEILEALG